MSAAAPVSARRPEPIGEPGERRAVGPVPPEAHHREPARSPPGRAGARAPSGPPGSPRASSPGRPGSPAAAPRCRDRPGTRPGSWSRGGRGRRPPRPLDRGEVDVGGQVLAADVAVRVVVDAVAEVGAQRAVAAPDRVVQLRRRVAVVDEQQERRARGRAAASATQASSRGRSPPRWPSARRDPLRRRRAASAGVDGSASTSTNAPSRRRRRAARASRRPRADDPMDGQRVEDLVGEHDADDRRRRRRGVERRRSRPAAAEPRRRRLEPARLDLDRVVAERVGERRAVARRGRRGSASASVPVPAPYSRRTNGSGRPSRSQASTSRAGQRRAEDRVGLGRGQEVAAAARAARLGRGSSRRPGRTARAP